MVKKESVLTPYVRVSNPDIRLYNADCLANLTDVLEAGSVSVVVTSPLYNIGDKYNRYDDKRSDEAYVEWLGEVAAVLETVLEPAGSLFLNMGVKPSNPTLALEVALAFKKRFELQNVIHWVKSIEIFRSVRRTMHLSGWFSTYFVNYNNWAISCIKYV